MLLRTKCSTEGGRAREKHPNPNLTSLPRPETWTGSAVPGQENRGVCGHAGAGGLARQRGDRGGKRQRCLPRRWRHQLSVARHQAVCLRRRQQGKYNTVSKYQSVWTCRDGLDTKEVVGLVFPIGLDVQGLFGTEVVGSKVSCGNPFGHVSIWAVCGCSHYRVRVVLHIFKQAGAKDEM